MAIVVSEKSTHKAAAVAWSATVTEVDVDAVADSGKDRAGVASGSEMALLLELQRRPGVEHAVGGGEVVMLTSHSIAGDIGEVINFKG